MNNDDQKLIDEQLKKLPPELAQAIASTFWQVRVKEIAKENKLSPEQAATLERETMLVVYGFDDPRNFIDNLTRELGVSDDVATTIATSIEEDVLEVIAVKAEGKSAPEEGDLPMIESGEVAHDVPHIENAPVPPPAPKPQPAPQPAPTPAPTGKSKPSDATKLTKVELPTPNYTYSKGQDPYREPLV